MDWSTNRRGCAILVLVAALLIGIILYFVWDTRDETPSPSQGRLPPPTSQLTPVQPAYSPQASPTDRA